MQITLHYMATGLRCLPQSLASYHTNKINVVAPVYLVSYHTNKINVVAPVYLTLIAHLGWVLLAYLAWVLLTYLA